MTLCTADEGNMRIDDYAKHEEHGVVWIFKVVLAILLNYKDHVTSIGKIRQFR